MDEKNPIDIELRALKELFIEKFDRNSSDHEEIIKQTTKTNGSVRNLQLWQARIIGGVTVLSAMVLPVMIAIVIQWFTKKI